MKKLMVSLTAAVFALFLSASTTDAAVRVAVCSNVGNGAHSRNFVFCMVGGHGQNGDDEDQKPDIVQKNEYNGGDAVIIVGANTGGNTVKNNTGGDSGMMTGKIKGTVGIWTNANVNIIKY